MWTLITAMAATKPLHEMAFSFGYHIAIGGGVTKIGRSAHDLDLYFLPLIGADVDEDKLVAALEAHFNQALIPLHNYDRKGESMWSKALGAWTEQRRIDLFIAPQVPDPNV